MGQRNDRFDAIVQKAIDHHGSDSQAAATQMCRGWAGKVTQLDVQQSLLRTARKRKRGQAAAPKARLHKPVILDRNGNLYG